MNAREVPEPREFWINEYEDGGHGNMRESKEEALRLARVNSNVVRTIHVREVLEGDDTDSPLDKIKGARREERERIKRMVHRACDLGNIITPRQRDMIVSGIDSETVIRKMGDAP